MALTVPSIQIIKITDILYILYHIAIIAGSELSQLKVPLAPEHNCMNICKQIH